jgi:tetratricopeptide (TPR) repeat protein
MNEQRQQAYFNLIQSLLNCPSGEESEILAANQELLDTGFLQTIEAVVQMFSPQGDKNTANWLRNLAMQLGEVLNLDIQVDLQSLSEEEKQAYLQFLMEVLQTTADSSGNYQVVYTLLARNTDKIDGVLAEILRRWGTNRVREAEADKAEYLAEVIVIFSNLIQQFPLGHKGSNMEIAITGYEVALTIYTHNLFSYEWATIQNSLGVAYCYRILGERADNLERAITCYQQTLKIHTLDTLPQDWACAMDNLANAYFYRIRGDRADNIEKAITAYTDALSVRTREALPQDWAGTQNNLAIAYRDRIRGDRADNIEKAIAAYTDALSVYTREALPQDWATTQQNLANAYKDRILGDRADNIEKAIAAYTDVLSVHTREASPRDHAGTLQNLGILYQDTNQFTLAYKTFESAIATIESLREEIVSGEESKRKQAEQFNKVYSSMVEVCLELDNITEAIEYVERSKTRNLVEQILERDLSGAEKS